MSIVHPFMKVELLEEAGFKAAMFGLSLNKKQPPENMPRVAEKLAFKDYGHNKCLEHIMIWLYVRAPRYWWQEADTYRLSSKQSESTIHTLLKHKTIGPDMFEYPPTDASLVTLNHLLQKRDLEGIKSNISEGFIQGREWIMSYKTLRNIIIQRHRHPLPHWQIFIRDVLSQVQHPELLPGLTDSPFKGDQINHLTYATGSTND